MWPWRPAMPQEPALRFPPTPSKPDQRPNAPSMAQKAFNEVAVLLRQSDSVAVLKRSVKTGDELVNGSFRVQVAQNTTAGHKIALVLISHGEPVRKYGQIIAFPRRNILPGEHGHTHHLLLQDFGPAYQYCL